MSFNKSDTENKWIDKEIMMPFPHRQHVNRFSLGAPKTISVSDEKVTLEFCVNGREYKLYLAFHESGGMRIFSDSMGFYGTPIYKKLIFRQEDGRYALSAEDGIGAVIEQSGNSCLITLLHNSAVVGKVDIGRISLGFSENGELSETGIYGSVGEDEVFTGLGERYDSLVRNGTESLLWNIDAGFQIRTDDVSSINCSYTNIPLLHSSNGYSMFINSSFAIYADIGKSNPEEYSFEALGPTFDVFYWTGEPFERLNGYFKLTGYNILPPKWAFSYWAGNSAIYFANANGGDYKKTLKEMMNGYAEIGIPIKTMFVEGVIHRDPEVYELLNKTETRVIAWHDSGYTQKHKLEGVGEDDLPYLKPYYGDRSTETEQKYCDYTNPNAFTAMDSMHGKYIKLGIKGSMIDFADAVPYNSVFHNGKTGDEMHNLYSYLYQEHFKRLYEKYNGSDYILFARAGFPGSQSLMTKFLGDERCTFNGLRVSLTSGLSLSVSGFFLWGSDMGGLGFMRKEIPDEDCYRRWLQWAAFNPIMRSHGHTTRAPWDFSRDAVRDFQRYYWLRENLADSLYSCVIDGSRGTVPVAEPMQMAFPHDKNVACVDDEYMFCRDILVAPVLTARALARYVILPEGKWVDFWTGLEVKGGKQFRARAAEGTIPLYLRSGTLLKIKLASSFKLCDNMLDGEWDALLITAAEKTREAVFNLTEDEKVSFTSEFKNGATVITNNSGANIEALLAKGITAEKITVDGISLELCEEQGADKPVGYAVDFIRNTTTVHLPKKWQCIEIFDSGLTAENSAFEKFIHSEKDLSSSFERTIADGWSFNYWTVPRTNAIFTLDLENESEISEIQLTWGIDYADSYKIDISADGENWVNAFDVTDGMGDEEILKPSQCLKARYIKFYGFGFAQRTPAILGDIRVYGTKLKER